MLPKIKLYIHNKQYYYVDDELPICNICEVEIETILILAHTWTRKQFTEKIYCIDCIPRIRKIGIVDEFKHCIYSRIKRDEFYPVFVQPPSLASSTKYNAFTVMNKPSEAKLQDHARRSREFSRIDQENYEKTKLSFESSDKLLDTEIKTVEEFDEQIEIMTTGTLLIAGGNKDVIEHKRSSDQS